jgi:hypothetical protein
VRYSRALLLSCGCATNFYTYIACKHRDQGMKISTEVTSTKVIPKDHKRTAEQRTILVKEGESLLEFVHLQGKRQQAASEQSHPHALRLLIAKPAVSLGLKPGSNLMKWF